ncbi:MAG: type II secretion system protein [Clostridia bacterium]|nr:type II secretion system protein [Clostridia bacterium]
MGEITKNKKERKNNKGITIIALVVTIVILLILAGVTFAILTGENGILKKAQIAKELAEQKKNEENSILKQYEELLGLGEKQELPDNTEKTEAGTIVKLPNDWLIIKPDEVSTKDGEIVIPSKKIANVYAVSDGNANTVPVPYGFYYVGGTVESGVVISDDAKDKNRYKGLDDVPAGVTYYSDGTVNKENSELQGNQFVWVPVEEKNYVKIDFGLKNSTGYDTSTNLAEFVPIRKYNGFYVGRYEAGTSELTLEGNVKFETASVTVGANWENANFISSKVIEGKITSKAGEIPYYHADYTTAMEMTKNMYDSEYVMSGLITGTMWDVMMNFLTTDQENYSDLKNSLWGNHKDNTSVNYIAGRGRYLEVNINNGSLSDAVVADDSYHCGIRTTASTEDVKRKNLYDVAGNMWEWTQEMCFIANRSNLMYNLRGGNFGDPISTYTVCFRGFNNATNTSTNRRFPCCSLYVIMLIVYFVLTETKLKLFNIVIL